MKTQPTIVAIALLLFAQVASLSSAAPPALLGLKYKIEKESKLSIRGTTNVNSFECISKQTFEEQSVRVTTDGQSQRVVFRDAILQLRVDGLDCDNSKMNEDLQDALLSEDYPYIVIQLHEARLTESAITSSAGEIIVKASLTISGKTRKINIKATGTKVADNRFRFVAEHWIRMTDFGVDPPTALLGLIKVRDDIAIQFDLVARVTEEGSMF